MNIKLCADSDSSLELMCALVLTPQSGTGDCIYRWEWSSELAKVVQFSPEYSIRGQASAAWQFAMCSRPLAGLQRNDAWLQMVEKFVSGHNINQRIFGLFTLF